MSDPFVRWLQSRLASHGFPTGAIDGVFDRIVTEALKAFQAGRGLPQTGQGDSATVAALRQTSATLPPDVAKAIGERLAEAKRPVEPVLPLWPRQAEVPAFYGAVGTNQVLVDLPFEMFLAWSKTTAVRRISLHEKVASSARRVFETVAAIYSAEERKALGLDLFGGSLNVRRMRGGKAYSMHSWGIAIDFDPERNQLQAASAPKSYRDRDGDMVRLPAARLSHPDALPFWRAWEAEGWLSLGRARDFDWMHVQAARL